MKNTKNKNQFDFLKDKCIFYITGIANVKWVVIWLRMPTKDTFLFYFILFLSISPPSAGEKAKKEETRYQNYRLSRTEN